MTLWPTPRLSCAEHNKLVLHTMNIVMGLVLVSHGVAVSLSHGGIVTAFSEYFGSYGITVRFVVSSLFFVFGGLMLIEPVHQRWKGIVASLAFLPWVVIGTLWGIEISSFVTGVTLISLFLFMVLSQLFKLEE